MSGVPYYRIAVSYNTGTGTVYTYSSYTSSGFSSKFTLGQNGTGAGSIITITNSVTSSLGGVEGALKLMPTSAYICYATAAPTMAAWDANPTFAYKSIQAGVITEVTTNVTPTLNIVTALTSFLGGTGQLQATGDSGLRVLAYIFLQFNSDIV
jgi:hypothetical protein